MRLHAAIDCIAEASQPGFVLGLPTIGARLRPTERKVGSRDNLDEVHKVEVRVVSGLLNFVERVDMVVRPGTILGVLPRYVLGQLGSETKLVDFMLE